MHARGKDMRSVASVRPALRGRGAEPRAADSPNAPPALRQKGLPLSPHGGHGGHASPLPPPGQERPSAGGNAALLRPACPPRPGLAAGMPQRPGTRPRNLPAATPQPFYPLPPPVFPMSPRGFSPPGGRYPGGRPPGFWGYSLFWGGGPPGGGLRFFRGAAGPQARAAPLLYLSSHRWVPRFFSVTATGRRETYLLFHTWVCSMRLATRCRSFALSTASICR